MAQQERTGKRYQEIASRNPTDAAVGNTGHGGACSLSLFLSVTATLTNQSICERNQHQERVHMVYNWLINVVPDWSLALSLVAG